MNAADLLDVARVDNWPTSSIEVLANTQAPVEGWWDEVDDELPALVRPYMLPRKIRAFRRMKGTL